MAVPMGTSVADFDEHAITGLTNGTAYTFELRAVNAVGSGDSSRVSATPGVPDPPMLSVETEYGLTLRIRLGAANGSPITSTESRIYTLDSHTGDTTWVSPTSGRWRSSSINPNAGYYSSLFTVGWSVGYSYLSDDVGYTFEVRSVNSAGKSAVAHVAYAPEEELELSAVGGDGEVALSWVYTGSAGGDGLGGTP